MNELQNNLWDLLCDLNGEQVASLFTNFYGNQLLSDDFAKFIVEEGYYLEGFEEEEEED